MTNIIFQNIKIEDDGIQWIASKKVSPTRFKPVAYVHANRAHIARALRWKGLLTPEQAEELNRLLELHLPEVHPDTVKAREEYVAAFA